MNKPKQLALFMVSTRGHHSKSQEALAKASGVPVGTIRGIEQGQVTDPRISTFAKLARSMELSASEVFSILSEY